MRFFLSVGFVVLLSLGVAVLSWAEPAGRVGPDPQQWDNLVDKAIAYLRTAQAEDGSWSRDKNIGVTGVVLTGVLETGKLSPREPMVAKGLKYVESLINPQTGHIAGKDP